MKAVWLCIFVSSIILVIPAQEISAQVDIAKLMSPKYDLQVDEHTYKIHYGYHGSLESDIEELKTEILPQVGFLEIIKISPYCRSC